MKILIMGFTKIKYMPYMNFYVENIGRDKNEVHILYWNRDLEDESTEKYFDCKLHEFRCYQEDDVSKLSKLGSFYKYRRFAKRLIKEEKFDFILVLHTLTGVLIADVLKRRYKGRYIFDYRDSTYEKFAPFKKIVGELVENSVATFVSSDAFRRFLPERCESKIYTSHNLLTDSLLYRDYEKTPSERIRIAFWGFIRHEDINREIIRKISADPRFELHYYGREQQVALNLKQYAKDISSSNVFFHGEYKPEDRYDFVKETDLIHNLYYDSNTLLAMGNKYYDGLIFRIPQLCMRGSFMAECSQRADVGCVCDPYEDDFTEKIYRYFHGLDSEAFNSACDVELDRVLKQYSDGVEIINENTKER